MAPRVLWRLLPSLAVLLAVLQGRLLLLLLRALLVAVLRLVHVAVVAIGALVVWTVLRWYQLGVEQELYDAALLQHRFFEKYRRRRPPQPVDPHSGSNGFQLKVVKRLPVATHLRTAWGLAPEIADEIASFVALTVRDYVNDWFTPVSPSDDFPHDVRFLLADLLGALVARVLEIDSTRALTMAAKSVELLRLHLGWFREAYAQLAEDHPHVFADQSDESLRTRQALVAAYVQQAKFLHPGCVQKKTHPNDAADVLYLRHVATQLLVQLKPELGAQSSTNLFVSIAMNFLREGLVFKVLKPVFEYSQPRYANELVVAALLEESDANEANDSPLPSPTNTTASSTNGLDGPNAKSLRLTKSFLYKASKRSTVQAEAALHAVFDAVSSAASTASSGMNSLTSLGSVASPTSADLSAFGTDFWSESAAFGLVSPRSPTLGEPLNSPQHSAAAAPTSNERKGGAFASIFSLDDHRISFPKTPRLTAPRFGASNFTSGMSIISATGLGVPDTPNGSSTHMDDLKNMKANLESSLNSSLFKVTKTFRNIGGQSQMAMSNKTSQAANLIKRPGMLFQKALRRTDTSSTDTMPTSPLSPPPLTLSSSQGGEDMDDGESDEVRPVPSPTRMQSPTAKALHMQDRVLLLLEKTTANFTKLYHDRVEMRSSARSRELYEFLSALEDVLMLGYRKPSEDGPVTNGADTPPGSPSSRLLVDPSSVVLRDPGQLYWNYLAQDRPDTPFLNTHWQFVETQCPKCADSETFYSTRGVQWILVALERSMLWEYFTALHLHRRLTEVFYDEVAVLRNGKVMEKMLKILLPLTKLQVKLEIPHALGRQSELEKELGISRPVALVGVSSSSQLVRVVETAWEVERYVPIQGWVKSQDKRSKELPSSEWIWETEWTLEASAVTRDPSDGQRRSIGAGSDSSDVETGGSWEYGKPLNRFHEKEKTLDSVRRRKWTRRRRQLPQVLSATGLANSDLGQGARSPQLEAQQSPRRHASRQGSWDADDVEFAMRKKNPAMLTKRRSFSIDKGAVASPKAVPSPAPSPSPPPRSTGMGGVFRRKKRASSGFSSLRRSLGGRTPDSTPTNKPPPEAVLSDDDGLSADASTPSGYMEDCEDDDDGNLCFRCFKALGSESAKSPTASSCQSCHQRVCGACHDFYAFLVYPPPLESARKEQVCGGCYERLVGRYKLKIDAHVGKYFIKVDHDRDACDGEAFTGGGGADAPLSPTSSSASSPTRGDANATKFRYEVTVQVRDESSYAWSVIKSFHEFEELEKQLLDKLKKQEKKYGPGHDCRRHHWRGVDYSELRTVEPSLKQFRSSTSTAGSAALTYEKKLFVLEVFLQRLVQCDTLAQSSVVQKFLLLGDTMSGSGAASFPSLQFANQLGDGSPVATAGGSLKPTAEGTPGRDGGAGVGAAATGPVMVETGKWRRGKWIAPETNSKETKMRVLQQLEVSLFAVLNEVFELDGMGLLRRHLFSMTRSVIKTFLSASHFRKIERQYLTFTDPKKMATHLSAFRAYMFPKTPVEPPPLELSDAEMHAVRKKSLDAILTNLPSTIVSVVGDASSANAALKLHEFLQHEIFVKNFLFSMCDELLPHVFPDTVAYTPKTKASKAAT